METKPEVKEELIFPRKADHLLLLLTAASGIVFFMLNLKGGHVRSFFDFFNPGSIAYWLELIFNLSLLIAPVFVVVGAVKMANIPEQGWYLFFAGTAFHSFLLLGFLRNLLSVHIAADLNEIVKLICSLLCAFASVWLFSGRVRSFANHNSIVITIALTGLWLLFPLLHFLVNLRVFE